MCNFDKELLSAFHDKQLSVSEMNTVAAHLQSCEECKRTIDEYSSLSSMLRSMEPPRVSVEKEAEKIMASPALQREKNIVKFSRYLEFAVGAAACLLVALIAFYVVNAPKNTPSGGTNTIARTSESRTATGAEDASREVAKLPREAEMGKKGEADGKTANDGLLTGRTKVEKIVSRSKDSGAEPTPHGNVWQESADASEEIDDVVVLNCVDVDETQKAVTDFVLQNGNNFRRAGNNEYVVELDSAQQEQLLAWVGNNCRNKVTFNSMRGDYAPGTPGIFEHSHKTRQAAPEADASDTAKRDEKAKAKDYYSGKSGEPTTKPQNLPQSAGKGGDLALAEKTESKKTLGDQTTIQSASGVTMPSNQQAQKIVPGKEAGQELREQTVDNLDKDLAQKEGVDRNDLLRSKSLFAQQDKLKKEEEKLQNKTADSKEAQHDDIASQTELFEESAKSLEEFISKIRLNRGRWTFGNRAGNFEQRKSVNRQVLLVLNRMESIPETPPEPALKQTEKSGGK